MNCRYLFVLRYSGNHVFDVRGLELFNTSPPKYAGIPSYIRYKAKTDENLKKSALRKGHLRDKLKALRFYPFLAK